jgi:hypothetical protein
MRGKAGHLLAVVHAPAVLAREVLAEAAARQRRSRAELRVAGRVLVVVEDAEQERIGCAPGKAFRAYAEDGIGH